MADLTTLLSKFLDSLYAGTVVIPSPGVVQAGDGSASAPSYSFASETNTGLYRTNNSIKWSIAGTLRGALFSNSIDILDDSGALRLGSSVDVSLSRGAANNLQMTTTNTATTGTLSAFAIRPTYNQASGDAANTDLLINRTQTAVGSGAQRFIDAQIAGATRFSVDSDGTINSNGGETIYQALAIPAGGTTGRGYRFSSTSNFGIFFGSGVPTLSAAQGSLYVRSDGSSTSTRLYVNTNGSTTWTNVTTAA